MTNRTGLDYQSDQKGVVPKANGSAPAYMIKLDTVSLGTITAHNVDATVMGGATLSQPLLGLSFFYRKAKKRDGDTATLTARFLSYTA